MQKEKGTGLGNLADEQMKIGALKNAEANLRRRIALGREIKDPFTEAIGHQMYGRLLAYCGRWEEAVVELEQSYAYNQATSSNEGLQRMCIDNIYRAIVALLQEQAENAQGVAQEALRLAGEYAQKVQPVERDFVRAHWLMGWSALALGQHGEAQTRLDEALRRCRAINAVADEPVILLAQARLARARSSVGAGLVPAQSGQSPEGQPQKERPQGSPHQQSLAYAEEARRIAERSGYVLNLADIHNHLALLALDAGDREGANQHAAKARDYAWCNGPPYVYQPALDEANRILGELGS